MCEDCGHCDVKPSKPRLVHVNPEAWQLFAVYRLRGVHQEGDETDATVAVHSYEEDGS